MNALVIGAGSIGRRHAKLLQQRQGVSVHLLPWREVSDLSEELLSCRPDLVVICNRTSDHRATLGAIRDVYPRVLVLVEKPLFGGMLDKDTSVSDDRTFVGYNLRFHPTVLAVREAIGCSRVVSAHLYCSSYLPLWRPERPLKEVYSAHSSLGGGVIRDLSHELDLANLFLGDLGRITCYHQNSRTLEIDSDEICDIIGVSREGASLNIHLDYLSRVAARGGIISTSAGVTLVYDLIAGTLTSDGGSRSWTVDLDDLYRLEHEDLLTNQNTICSYAQALQVERIIEAAETAAATKTWINL